MVRFTGLSLIEFLIFMWEIFRVVLPEKEMFCCDCCFDFNTCLFNCVALLLLPVMFMPGLSGLMEGG